MGIKTYYKLLGGQSFKTEPIPDYGDMGLWTYTTNNKTKILTNYKGNFQQICYVPRDNGKTLVNDGYHPIYVNGAINVQGCPFKNNKVVHTVDFQQVDFVNSNMSHTFEACTNLKNITNLSPNLKSMYFTFVNCFYFDYNVQIPEGVTNMVGTFCRCYNFNQNIKIPSTVKDMYATFSQCNNFNHNFQIPEGVVNIGSIVGNCYKFDQNLRIPNSVKDMYHAFANCWNLNQNIKIPHGVTKMWWTFANCYKLNQSITIPNSVTGIDCTFHTCNGMNHNWRDKSNEIVPAITIYTSEGYCQTNALFANCTPNTITVLFPTRYINNSKTRTNQGICSGANIATIGISNVRKTYGKAVGVMMWDFVGGDYDNYVGNGTHWILKNCSSNFTHEYTYRGTSPILGGEYYVPKYIISYNKFPTALNYTCYQNFNFSQSGSSAMGIFHLNSNIPWNTNMTGSYSSLTSYSSAFKNSINLGTVYGSINGDTKQAILLFANCTKLVNSYVTFSEGVKNVFGAYMNCYNLVNVAPFASTTEDMSYTFYKASNLKNAPIIPPSVQNLHNTFAECTNLAGNIYILSPNVTNIENLFYNSNKYLKNVYIPEYYSNGEATQTKLTFDNYTSSSVDNVSVQSLSNIYTSMWDFHMQTDMVGEDSVTFTVLDKFKANYMVHTAVFPRYPDGNVMIGENCFNSRILTANGSLALYGARFNTSNLSGKLYGANSYAVQGLNLSKSTSMTNMFYQSHIMSPIDLPTTLNDASHAFSHAYYYNCYTEIPNSVNNMVSTFEECWQYNQETFIPNSVTNLYATFRNCQNFNRPIEIPEGVIDMSYTFAGCYKFNKDIIIPSTVTNMAGTFSKTLTSMEFNKSIDIPEGVTNIAYLFNGCHKFNQYVKIPNSVTNLAYAFAGCCRLNYIRDFVIDDHIESANGMFQGACNYAYGVNMNFYVYSTTFNNLWYTFKNFGHAYGTHVKLYIPYKYKNNSYTKIFNDVFMNRDRMGLNSKLVTFTDLGVID